MNIEHYFDIEYLQNNSTDFQPDQDADEYVIENWGLRNIEQLGVFKVGHSNYYIFIREDTILCPYYIKHMREDLDEDIAHACTAFRKGNIHNNTLKLLEVLNYNISNIEY